MRAPGIPEQKVRVLFFWIYVYIFFTMAVVLKTIMPLEMML